MQIKSSISTYYGDKIIDNNFSYQKIINVNFCIKQIKLSHQRGSVAKWLARRTRDLEVAGSIPDQAML